MPRIRHHRTPHAPKAESDAKVRKKNNHWRIESEHKVWTTTYWPYADFSGTGRGDPTFNLWAEGGPLAKLDRLREHRGLGAGAEAHERLPALAWLKGRGEPSGHFIPSDTLKECDAERTTGVDLTGNGKVEADTAFDFLDDFDNFGKNGRTDGTMDVGWWGSCDQVAVAGQLFKAPKRGVTVDGVHFTPQDIKGLLTVIANCQGGRTETVGTRTQGAPDRLTLKSGRVIEGEFVGVQLSDLRTGDFARGRDNMMVHQGASGPVKIKTAGGKVHTYPASQIKSLAKEDIESLTPSAFHKTVKLWLRQDRPFAMDHDRGPHVWNDCYDRADIDKTRKVPRDIDVAGLNGAEGPYGGGDICFYTTRLRKGSKVEKTYRYWIEKKDGVDLNSGWLGGRGVDDNPDFLWRPQNGKPSFTGANQRNPFVSPDLVKEIYEASI